MIIVYVPEFGIKEYYVACTYEKVYVPSSVHVQLGFTVIGVYYWVTVVCDFIGKDIEDINNILDNRFPF